MNPPDHARLKAFAALRTCTVCQAIVGPHPEMHAEGWCARCQTFVAAPPVASWPRALQLFVLIQLSARLRDGVRAYRPRLSDQAWWEQQLLDVVNGSHVPPSKPNPFGLSSGATVRDAWPVVLSLAQAWCGDALPVIDASLPIAAPPPEHTA